MKRLFWHVWFASPRIFVVPGLYWCRSRNRRLVPLPQWPEPMHCIEFPEQTVVMAKDQPEYRPLPAYWDDDDPRGKVVCCWKLNWLERLKLLATGRLWHEVLTFNGPLQPQLLTVEKPEMSARKDR